MFNCPIYKCTIKNITAYDLKEHIFSCHPNEIDKYPRMSTKSTKLNKPWKCPITNCVCGYTTKCALRSHILKKHPIDAYKYSHLINYLRKSKIKNNDGLCIRPIELDTSTENRYVKRNIDDVMINTLIK